MGNCCSCQEEEEDDAEPEITVYTSEPARVIQPYQPTLPVENVSPRPKIVSRDYGTQLTTPNPPVSSTCDDVEDSDQEREFAKQQEAKKQRLAQLKIEMEQEERDDFRSDFGSVKFEETRKRFRDENDRKNLEKDLETEREIKRIKDEGEAVRNQPNRKLAELEEKSKRLDDEFQKNESRYNHEQYERKLTTKKTNQDHHDRLKNLEDQFELERQKLQIDHENKKKEIDRQTEETQKMMMQGVWNDEIERNWTNRLNGLRRANKDCKELGDLCLTSHPNPDGLAQWRDTVEALKKIMEQESENLTEMYNSVGKMWILKIKNSVDKIAQDCSTLSYGLSMNVSVEEFQKISRKLNRSCLEVPTLAELKNEYYNEMRSNTSF